MELSKPKILNPKINSKNTSIQTINRTTVQEKIIFFNMSKCNKKYLNEKINRINFMNKKLLLIEFVKSITKNEFKIRLAQNITSKCNNFSFLISLINFLLDKIKTIKEKIINKILISIKAFPRIMLIGNDEKN